MSTIIRHPVAYLLRGNEPPEVHEEIAALENLGQPVIVTTVANPVLRIRVATDSVSLLLRRPVAVVSIVASLLVALARRNAREALLRLPLALHLAAELRRRGVHHLHAPGDLAATIAWMIERTADLPFSCAFDPHGTLLRAKAEKAQFLRGPSGSNVHQHPAATEALPYGSASAPRLAALFARPESAATSEIIQIDWRKLGVSRIGIRWSSWRYDAGVAEVSLYGEGQRHDVVVKQHSRRPPFTESAAERARNELETLEKLSLSMPERTTVPRVLLFEPETLTLVMEKAPGEPLDRAFPKFGESDIDLLAGIARSAEWLRTMQRVTGREVDGAPYVAHAVDLARADLERVAEHDAAVRRRLRMLEQRMTDLAATVGERAQRVAGHHGDFWPGNVFIAPEAVTVIDFEGYREGLPAEDVAYFLIRTELLSRRFGRHAPPLQQAFVEAWDDLERDELQLFTLTKTLRTYVNILAGNQQVFQRIWTTRALRDVLLRTLSR